MTRITHHGIDAMLLDLAAAGITDRALSSPGSDPGATPGPTDPQSPAPAAPAASPDSSGAPAAGSGSSGAPAADSGSGAPAAGADQPHNGMHAGEHGKVGTTGKNVRDAQLMLVSAGLGSALGAPGVDGKFGPLTEEAVKQFQHSHHLPETGIIDDATNKSLTTEFQKEYNKKHPDNKIPETGVIDAATEKALEMEAQIHQVRGQARRHVHSPQHHSTDHDTVAPAATPATPPPDRTAAPAR